MKIKPVFALSISIVVLLFSNFASADPAVVITNQGCLLPTPDDGIVFSTDSKIVATQSANGVRTFKCQIKGVSNSTGQAIRANGNQLGIEGCMISIAPSGPFCLTSNWSYVVSASGNAKVSCQCTNDDNI